MSLSKTHVTIVGLGLMGGSLALALRGKCAGLTGVDTDRTACDKALGRGVVDFVTQDFSKGVASAGLLILATPVKTILAQLDLLTSLLPGPNRRQPLPILDLGSTKQEIAAAMAQLPECFDPIGGHPMCGKETSGLAHADASLFQEATFALTPLERTSSFALSLAEELVQAVGARALILDPRTHDELVAVTSHLPYLLASSLMAAASARAATDDRLWSLVASGFRDTTRLAGSDVRVMVDILRTNREPIAAALARHRAALARLEALLADKDDHALCEFLNEIRTQRLNRT